MGFGLRRRRKPTTTGRVTTQAVAAVGIARVRNAVRAAVAGRISSRKLIAQQRLTNKKTGRLTNQKQIQPVSTARRPGQLRANAAQNANRPRPRSNRRINGSRFRNRIRSAFQFKPTTPRTVCVETTPARIVKPPQAFKRLPSEKFSDDTLDLATTALRNGIFQPVEENGISVFRPEIIAVTDYEPVFTGDMRYRKYSPAGNLVNIQRQAAMLRQDTAGKFLTSLEEWSEERAGTAFEDVKKKYNEELSRTKRTIQQLSTFIDVVESSKSRTDIKNIPKDEYDTSKFLALPDLFEARHQFSKSQQSVFSDSKLYMQLCADFKSIMENYSFSLLDLTDTDRISDSDPVDIDNTYTTQDGFTLDVNFLRSENNPENAAESARFNTFLGSLPENANDRIKLLMTLLSKEYRVSKNLARSDVKRILSAKYNQGDTGSPFDNLVGIPGDTIFDLPVGADSLSSLGVVTGNDNTVILPFERKYIDSTKASKRTYIPGSSFFFDSILEVGQRTQFNTSPYSRYANLFSAKVEDSKQVITKLFELDDTDTRLTPEVMSDSFMISLKDSMSGLVEAKSINSDQAALMAIFALANTNNQLKNSLFQFLLLVGVASHTTEDVKTVFRQLGGELRTTEALQRVQKINGVSVNLETVESAESLQPYIAAFARSIEEQVQSLTQESSVSNRRRAGASEVRSSVGRNTVKAFVTSNISNSEIVGVVSYENGGIASLLQSSIKPRSSSSSNIVKEFFSLVNEFTQAANLTGDQGYLLPDQSGRTRYNFVSTSMQMLMMFEILSSFVDQYGFARFLKTKSSTSRKNVAVDVKNTVFTIETIVQVAKVPAPSKAPARSAKKPLPAGGPTSSPAGGTSNSSVSSTSRAGTSRLFAAFRARLNGVSAVGGSGQAAITRISQGLLNVSGDDVPSRQSRRVLDSNISSPFLGSGTFGSYGISEDPSLFFTRTYVQRRRSMFSIKEKVGSEDKAISNIIHVFEVLSERLQNTKTIILNTFNSTTIDNFKRENDVSILGLVLNPTQLRASAFLLENYEDIIRSNHSFGSSIKGSLRSILVSPLPSDNIMHMFYSLLAEPEFGEASLADERLKLVTVGIPAGFSKNLSDRITREEINQTSFNDKQFDVMKVNVYKRDVRFDDIVFKPKTFIFDLSIFAGYDNLHNAYGRRRERFDRQLLRVSLTDYQKPSQSKLVTIDNIRDDDQYSFLTADQRSNLFLNHTRSELLEYYINFLTGMKLDESTFLADDITPGTQMNPLLEGMVREYIKEIVGTEVSNRPMAELISDPSVDVDTKDMLRLMVYGSVMFEPNVLRQQVTSDKLFDRVFHIPVGVENYEVDEELTNSSESGRLSLKQNFVQNKLFRTTDGKLVMQASDENDIIFNDFFVTIETDF